ncbi:MAG: SWIM zinc finger family protein, partial [Myxococcota bacterium]
RTPHPEWVGAQALLGSVVVARNEVLEDGRTIIVGKVGPTPVETVLDSDGVFRSARCTCSYFRRNRLRAGPCRHLLALRLSAERLFERPNEAP